MSFKDKLNNWYKNFKTKLRDKYRLVIYNDTSFEEVFHLKLNRINVFNYGGMLFIFMLFLVFLLILFTPLREFMPQHLNVQLSKEIQKNSIILDSLKEEIRVRNLYILNIMTIVRGNEPDSFLNKRDTTLKPSKVSFVKSVNDSILRKRVATEEASIYSHKETVLSVTKGNIKIWSPLQDGVVTNRFNATEKHFGIDLVTIPNAPILACMDGTITLATWTLETGFTLQIQHANNVMSMYKHCKQLLKKEGDIVKAGESIAIIGNSGEQTTGPHLHFELWHNNVPVDPENYILF